MTDWLKTFRRTFGDDKKPGDWASEFDYWLRFELGGEVWGTDKPIRRFLQAHGRACAVAEFVFAQSVQVHALVLSFGDERGINTGFSRLMTVLPNVTQQNYAFDLPGSDREDDPERREFWHVIPISDPIQIKELLWLDIAHEMGISPSSLGHFSYLVDFERKLFLHAYDDRGMDLVAMDRETLKPTYDEYNDWLLNYDRPRMTPVFENP